MKVINIHEAKTHLSRLTEEVVRGEPFIIAKAGRPLVKVVPLDPPPTRPQALVDTLPAAPVVRDIRSLKGIVPHVGKPVSIEDMNAAIARMGRSSLK